MNIFRMPVGCVSSMLVLVVYCAAWSPEALGDHVRYRSVSREVRTIRGTATLGYFTVPVVPQSSIVFTVGSSGSSGASPSSATKAAGLKAQAGLVGGEITPPTGVDGGADETGTGSGDSKEKCEGDNKRDKGTSSDDAEKCRSDREALIEELKQLKASLASDKLSVELGKAEADLSEATVAHEISTKALTESVLQSKTLESEFHALVAGFQAETLAYSAIADKSSPEATAAAGRVAEQSVLMQSKEKELDVHAVKHETIKSEAAVAAAKYHASQMRFKALDKKVYGK